MAADKFTMLVHDFCLTKGNHTLVNATVSECAPFNAISTLSFGVMKFFSFSQDKNHYFLWESAADMSPNKSKAICFSDIS